RATSGNWNWTRRAIGQPSSSLRSCASDRRAGLALTTRKVFPLDRQPLAAVPLRVDAVRSHSSRGSQPIPIKSAYDPVPTVNCESVPRLPARAIRPTMDASRQIPYLLIWRDRFDCGREALKVSKASDHMIDSCHHSLNVHVLGL